MASFVCLFLGGSGWWALWLLLWMWCMVTSMASIECMYKVMIVLTTRQVNREDTSAPCFFDIESSGHLARRGMRSRLSPSPFFNVPVQWLGLSCGYFNVVAINDGVDGWWWWFMLTDDDGDKCRRRTMVMGIDGWWALTDDKVTWWHCSMKRHCSMKTK